MSWEGKVAIMMDNYMRGQEDLTVRDNLFMSFLQSNGRIVMNCNSDQAHFTVKKKRPPVEGYAEAGLLNFAPRALWDLATLGWRGYVTTDQMNWHERLENKGNVQIVNRSGEIMENLVESVTDRFESDFFIDGGASGNETFIEGLETFMGTDGNTVVADLIANPSDTYFSLSTALGGDGTWTSALTTSPNATLATDWPEGKGDPEYDFWSPKLINWSSTSWGQGGNTWLLNGLVALRRTAQWMRLTNGAKAGMDLIAIMAGHLMTDTKSALDTYKRTLLPHPKARDLGFPEVLNFEGLGLHTESYCPVNTCYVVNFKKLDLCSLHSKLLYRFGPTWVLQMLAYLYLVGFYGNLRTKSPKYHAKMYPYAAS